MRALLLVVLFGGLVARAAETGDVQPTPAAEVEPQALPTLSGSLRAGYWRSSRDLLGRFNLGTASLWLRAEMPVGSALTFVVDGRAIEQNVPSSIRTLVQLREAYVNVAYGVLDLRLGQQIISWGRADGVNPTDNLTPKDLTLLVPSDAEQSLGTLAGRARFTLGTFSLLGYWLPYFVPNVVPFGPPPPSFGFDQSGKEWDLRQYAVKLDRSGGEIDWSLSFLDGLDVYPSALQVRPPSAAGPGSLFFSHRRAQVLGLDGATSIAGFGVRAEAALHRPLKDSSIGLHRAENLWVVAGFDRALENGSVSLQYMYLHVFQFQDPEQIADPLGREAALFYDAFTNQLDRNQHGATFRLAGRGLNDALEVECLVAAWLVRFNYLARARVSYSVTDHWKVVFGGDLFGGRTVSFFGRLQPNSTAFLELRRAL